MSNTPPTTIYDRTGIFLAIAGAIAFSLKAIVVKLAYQYGVDAITLVMLRMLIALPFFIALGLWSGRGKPPLCFKDWLRVTALGFSGYFLASTLDFVGLQYISASLERLIIYLNPTLVLLFGWLALNKSVSLRQWQAMLLSYAGVVLVFGHESLLAGSSIAIGSAFVFASAIVYAGYLVYSGETVKRVGAVRLASWASAVACFFCVLLFVLLRPASALNVAVPVLWLSLFNAIFCTVLPVVIVMVAVDRLGAGLVAQVGMIGPVSTIVLSHFVLDEPFTGWTLVGTLLVMVGIYWVTRPTPKA
jgi:drug/metabolite transporter (DMT)-like permease